MEQCRVSPLLALLALLSLMFPVSAQICTSVADVTRAWTSEKTVVTLTARWYPVGPVCDAACTAWPNSCVYGCILCDGSTTAAVGLAEDKCNHLNLTTAVLTPGSVVTITGKARLRALLLSGAELRNCDHVQLVSLAPPSPAAPPPPSGTVWDGTVRLLGPVVRASWKVFTSNNSVTFFVESLTDQFPIVGLSLGTSMKHNKLANSTGVPAYMGWIDSAGRGRVVSYVMTDENAASVVPTGEPLYGIRVMRANGRVSFQFNRRLQGSGSPATYSLDGTTPVPLQFSLFNTWGSADGSVVPDESDMHAVMARGYAIIMLYGAPPAAPPPPAVKPAPPHDTPAAPSEDDGPDAEAPVPRNVKAHAVFMALAWGFFFPCSQLVARHYKPLGQKTFLQLHVGLNALGGLCLIIGFACIRAYVSGDDNEHYTSLHSRLGLLIFIVWWLQPLNGVFRSKKEPGVPPSQMRKYWELAHKSLGRGLLVLALIVVTMGLVKLRDVGATHAAVGGGIAVWVLWCLFGLGGGAFYLERNASTWIPPAAITSDGAGLLDESELDHHFAHAPVGDFEKLPAYEPPAVEPIQ